MLPSSRECSDGNQPCEYLTFSNRTDSEYLSLMTFRSNDSSADIGEALFIGERCSNATGGPCLAHAGALQAYLEVKELTNSFALAESYVTATGHQWSVTGHGFGGMLAQIASLDLGWRNSKVFFFFTKASSFRCLS